MSGLEMGKPDNDRSKSVHKELNIPAPGKSEADVSVGFSQFRDTSPLRELNQPAKISEGITSSGTNSPIQPICKLDEQISTLNSVVRNIKIAAAACVAVPSVATLVGGVALGGNLLLPALTIGCLYAVQQKLLLDQRLKETVADLRKSVEHSDLKTGDGASEMLSKVKSLLKTFVPDSHLRKDQEDSSNAVESVIVGRVQYLHNYIKGRNIRDQLECSPTELNTVKGLESDLKRTINGVISGFEQRYPTAASGIVGILGTATACWSLYCAFTLI